MSTQNLSLCLAKVMIAAAWADGEVQPEEVDCLKEFILKMPGIDDEVWRHLDIYMSMPIDEDERLQLVEDLSMVVRSSEDEVFVLKALELVFKADGIFSQEEFRTIEQVKNMLSKGS